MIKSILNRQPSGSLHVGSFYWLRPMYARRHTMWSALFSLWCVFIASVSFGQSLQWSQYTGHNNSFINANSKAFAIERSSTGFLYVLGSGRKGTGVIPVFQTSDIQYIGTGGVDQAYVSLSKYSPDGSKLLWVRIFQNTTILTPMGLALNAAGEPLVLFAINPTSATIGASANPAFITANAWQSTANLSNNGSVAVLSKFDANGNRTYGTYVGPTGGSLTINSSDVNSGTNFSTLFSAPDGTTYLSFRVTKSSTQTGIIPTTAAAFQSNFTPSTLTSAVMVMIFKPDNSLQYSSYFTIGGSLVNNATMSKSGDLYVMMSGSGLGVMPPVTSGAASTTANGSMIMRFNKSGSIVANTWQTPIVGSNYNIGSITTNPTNGDVVTIQRATGMVRVYDANLTTLKLNTTPFGVASGGIGTVTKIAIDDIGRLHTLMSNANSTPITTGAFQSTMTNSTDGSYYGITDCSIEKVVYGTYLSDQNDEVAAGTSVPNDFVLDGCDTYIVGQTITTIGFPITPTAYNDNGTATVSGYRLTPTNTSTGAQGFMTKFNYPVMKPNTNVLTTPAITNFCADGGVLPIDGTKTIYITPTIIGNADSNPAPTPTHYQWQIASSATGPWTDIPDSDIEDLSPDASTAGTYFYRRIVRQTSFDIASSCVPNCDIADTSNVISLTFSTNKTHSTNLSSKTYAFCKNSSLAVSTTITPSADGLQAPYAYKLTTLSNLIDVVQGQSGTVSAAPLTIDLNITQEGKFLLQVTDSRGCTSFDTLNVEYLKQDAGSRIQFTCGATTIKLGPASPVGEYANFVTNTFSWSPSTGLDNVNFASPTLSILPAVGASADYYLTLNGCLVDTVTVKNESVTPLPALADIARCQGDTATLGVGIVSQAGVTYEWAPGLGLTSTSTVNPILTTLSAPAGVNVINYYLKAQNGTSGCVQFTTQKVTVYRTPNQSFQIKECMENSCSTTLPLGASNIGTVSEPGISYSWQALIIPGTATTGMPTAADVIAGLTNPTGAMTDFALANPTLGKTTGTYQVWLIRTSFNAANPACVRQDTAFYDYCSCGSGGNICNLALGAVPAIACGGPTNKIGPIQYASKGTYIWTRLDGTPINNELFDPITKVALTPGGPHPNQVIANPSGLVAVSYRLTLINPGADTCRIDIKVFPGAIGKPNVNYSSPQSVCQGTPYTIVGPAANPGLTYLWSPESLLATLADTAIALPTIKGLAANTSVYVTVTDPSTGCSVQDTVSLVVSPVIVEAGDNATFCSAGDDISVGAGAGLAGYTYQWTAVPASGVVFGNPTLAQTTVSLPATAVGGKITLYLTATNGQTAANCSLMDSVVFTSAASPVISIPITNKLCAGGTLNIGPVTPAGLTYAWSGPGIIGSTTGSSISVNAAGTYTVTATQGTCVGSSSIDVSLATPPTVTPNPPASCAGPATIGVNNAADAGWTYTWDKLDGLKSYAPNFSTITVEPSTNTTYTLTATHASGCVLTFPIDVIASAYTAQLPTIYNFCEGGSSTLALNTAPSGATYAWTASPADASDYLSSTSSAQPSVNLSTAPAGTYTYTVTVSYGSGCQSTASTTVRVGKKISNVAGFDAEICKGTCTSIGLTAVSGVNYEWSASPADPTLMNIYSAKPTVCPTETTTYTIRYSNASGCVFTDEVVVKVLPTPTLTVKDVVACGPVTLDLATAIVNTTGTTSTYWLNSSATIAATNPVNTSGTYYIKLDDAVCSVIMPVNVTFSDLPDGTLKVSYNCETQKGTLQISNVTPGARYDYTTGATYTGSKTFATASIIGGGGLLSTNLPTPPIGGQSYTVRLFGSDSTCYNDITVELDNLCPVGSLGDFVWKDLNDNGQQDAGEPGVNGVKVILWSAVGGAPGAKLDSTTTAGNGAYSFTNLGKGDYIVQIDVTTLLDSCLISSKQNIGDDASDNDFSTDGLSEVVTLDPTLTGLNKDNPTIDAGLISPKGSLGDFVWKDLNDNGQQDDGEPGVNGVKVILWSAVGGAPGAKLDSTTTAGNGAYSFTNLGKGDYIVQIDVTTLPDSCLISSKQNIGDDASDNDFTTAGLSTVVTLDPTLTGLNKDNPTIDAGLISPKGSLGDFVWKDLNDNGQQDVSEPGVNGVKVILWSASASGQPLARLDSTTTAGNGAYSFTNLGKGDYIVQIDVTTLPDSCLISSKQNIGNDASDNDFTTDGLSPVVTLDPTLTGLNKDNPTIDAGLISPKGSLGDFVWKDLNDNGQQDAGEPGVNGVKVILWSAVGGAPGAKLDSTITAGNGAYSFTNLLAGDYIVQIDVSTLPDSCLISPKQNIGNDASDNDFTTDGLSPVVTLDPTLTGLNKDNPTIDAGLISPKGSLGDFVWKDLNDNGQQDAGEPGVNGVKVILWSAVGGAPGAKLDSTTTAGNGAYSFTNLLAGDYIVQIDVTTLPDSCLISSKQNVGNDASDNDFSTAGLSPVVTLDPTLTGLNKDNPTIDAGLISPKGSLGDFVWKDLNDNGQQDAGEPGVNGVKVILWSAVGGAPGAKLDSTTTAGNGAYSFTNLLAGDYIVQIDVTTLPDSCLISSKQNIGNDASDNDFTTAGLSPVVTLDPTLTGLNKDNPTIDAGLISPKGSLGDFVWKDLNDNGQQDAGEPGVNGVKVILWSAVGGAPGAKLDSTTTAGNGAYSFTNLGKGDYIVQIDVTTLPDSCLISPKQNVGDDASDNDFTTAGLSPVVTLDPTLTGLNKDNPTIDAGLISPKGSLGDFVWKDLNDNGQQDAGEPGVNGVKVILWSAVGGAPGAKLDSTTTAGNGAYSFTNLLAGDYIVQIDLTTLPDSCLISSKQNVGNDASDNDFSTAGLSPVVTLDPTLTGLNKDNPTIDAGLISPKGSLGDFVWKDLNDNGQQDAGEPGVNGVKVILWSAVGGAPGAKLDSTTTTGNGAYSFTNLLAGDYIVQIDITTLPDSCLISSKQNIGDDASDNDFTTAGLSPVVTLDPTLTGLNKDNPTIDAGLISPKGSLGDFVWKDLNDNGQQDAGEPGVNGVKVILWSAVGGAPGAKLDSTTTAGNGAYSFSNLGKGDYIVQIDVTTLPDSCLISSKQNIGNNASDNDFTTAGLSPVVTLDPTLTGLNKDNPTIDAGLISPCVAPTFAATDASAATCDGKTAQNDASFVVTGISGGNKFSFATSVAGLANYSSATALTGSTITVANLPNPVQTTGQTYIVRIFNGKDDCFTDVSILVPYRDCADVCVKPDAGPAQVFVCQPETSVILPDAAAGEEWISAATNPFSISISAQTGVVSGLNENGVYMFILRDATLGSTCSDTVFVFRGVLELPNQTTCFDTLTLPTVAGATWTAMAGNPATITSSGKISGMNSVATNYSFIISNGQCSDTIVVTRLNCNKTYDLALDKAIDKKLAMLGETLTYTIRVWNEGEATAHGIEVTDELNAGVQYLSSTADIGSYSQLTKKWSFDSLAVGDTVSLKISVKIIAAGVWFNTAEITKMTEDDVDSTPGNGDETEDDIDRECFTVPVLLCRGQGSALTLNVPQEYTGVVWFRKAQNGQPVQVAIGNSYTASETELGTYEYTFTSTSGTCPAEGCCPVIIVVEDCCPVDVCVPFVITKKKK
ncbi:SdrD B-like domain-containing protein [Arundinibacter roseus]|nr:SdrD B-like domain-containing protein [Arundinibacter roseus]